MLKLLKYSAIVIVCSNAMVLLSGCSSSQGNKLRAYFGDMNGNDKVYVLPRKKLKNPKKIDREKWSKMLYSPMDPKKKITQENKNKNMEHKTDQHSEQNRTQHNWLKFN